MMNKHRRRRRQQQAGTLMILLVLAVGIILLSDVVSKSKLNYMYSYDDSSYSTTLISSSTTKIVTSGNSSFYIVDDQARRKNNSATAATSSSQRHHYNITKVEGTTTTKPLYEDRQNDTRSIFQQRIDDYFSTTTTTGKQQQEQHEANYYNISWIQEYLLWHDSMRRTFPESTIFNFEDDDDNNKYNTEEENQKEKPKIAIAYMDPSKNQGGLTDRFKGLGHLLWNCYKDKRVLFLKWYDAPLQLEAFLLPNLFNWTLPQDHINLQTAEQLRITFNSNSNSNSNDNDMKKDGSNHHHHLLVESNVRLYTFVSQLGNYKQPFDIIFDAYFQPSQWVQDGIDDAYHKLNLKPGQYDAVHLRIGHPAFRNKKKYDDKSKLFDKYGNGYNFSSTLVTTEKNNDDGNDDHLMVVKAINSATRAIECSKYLVQTQQRQQLEKLPLYFFSDSIDLIRTVVIDNDEAMGSVSTSNNTIGAIHSKGNDSTVLEAFRRLRNTTKHYPDRIIGRTNVPIAHLERRHHQSSEATTTATPDENRNITALINEAHKNTFVDLIIASKARCLSLGIGRYAYMARKISSSTSRTQQPPLDNNDNGENDDCWIRHAIEADSSTTAQWGMKLMYKEVPKCPTSIG